ncbi:MAG: hypothetical protein D4R81_09690 [Nitrospiraceae bacterium]|nr:MAG: hypothetical protein D4R81_09690 [Nitrospiraceae bacterium]
MATDEPPSPDNQSLGCRLAESDYWRDRYIQEHEHSSETERLSPETVATYGQKIQLFLDWWTQHAPEHALTQALAQAYQAWLLAEWKEHRRFTKRSYGLCLSGIRRWGTFLVAQHVLAANPFRTIRGPERADSHASGFLTRPDADRLLATFDRTHLIEHRDYVICRLMLTHGARETELCQATVGDVAGAGNDVQLSLNSKGKKKREAVQLTPAVITDIRAYLAHRHALGELVTPTSPLLAPVRTFDPPRNAHMGSHEMRRRIKLALARATLTTRHLTGVSLRHTAAIQAFLDKTPFDEVQAMMRHTDKKTTKIFEARAKGIRRRQARRARTPTRAPHQTRRRGDPALQDGEDAPGLFS